MTEAYLIQTLLLNLPQQPPPQILRTHLVLPSIPSPIIEPVTKSRIPSSCPFSTCPLPENLTAPVADGTPRGDLPTLPTPRTRQYYYKRQSAEASGQAGGVCIEGAAAVRLQSRESRNPKGEYRVYAAGAAVSEVMFRRAREDGPG